MIPSNYDLLVVITVAATIQVGGLIFLAWVAWRAPRELAAMVAESQQLNRAVGALIVQETDKIRALLADPPR